MHNFKHISQKKKYTKELHEKNNLKKQQITKIHTFFRIISKRYNFSCHNQRPVPVRYFDDKSLIILITGNHYDEPRHQITGITPSGYQVTSIFIFSLMYLFMSSEN